MKHFFAFIGISLWVAVLSAATLTPIQLLNPAGSTAGQAIISTGPSTAPAWSTPSLAAPGPIGNTTPSTGAFTALSATGAITPSSTAGIVGTTTNNNAAAGSVGEYVESQVSTVAITSGATINVTTISLTAGDWDLDGNCYYNAGAGASISAQACAVNTTSATLPAARLRTLYSYSGTTAVAQSAIAPTQRISIASTTTVYLIGFADYAGGTVTVDGIIRARRVR